MTALFGHTRFWNHDVSVGIVVDEFKKVMQNASTGEALTMSICCLFLSITIVVENSLVIAAVWKDPLKTLRSSPTVFILLELAIADLFVGLVLAPSSAIWYLRIAMKNDPWKSLFLVMMFSQFFLIVSVFHVLLLAIDRYFAIGKPLEFRAIITKRRVFIGSLSIWVFSFGYALLSLILQARVLVLWFIYVLLIWLLSEGISFLYLLTLRNLFSYYRTRITEENFRCNLDLLYQREKKVFVVILSVILVFYFCFIPWLTNEFLLFFCRACRGNYRLLIIGYHVATLLTFINSALNPLLYSWRFSKFRATFKCFWTTCFCQKGRRRRKTLEIIQEKQTNDTKL